MRELMEFKNSSKTTAHDHHHYFRALTQIFVSISVFYIIFFQSSPRFPFLLRSFNVYLSAIPLHSLDKRWVFLICNGILAILGLANTSGLVGFPSSSSRAQEDHRPQQLEPAAAAAEQVLLLENAPQLAIAELDSEDYNNDEEEEAKCGEEDEEESGEDVGVTIEEHREETAEKVEEIKIYIAGDDEEEEEDEHDEESENCDSNNGLMDPFQEEDELEEEAMLLEKLSAEELNKKFEDFIRKMKEELRIEAQQQHLVMVK